MSAEWQPQRPHLYDQGPDGDPLAPARGCLLTIILSLAPAAMDIDWMTNAELSQAIPPAYTEWIGARLLEHIEAAA